MAMSSAEIERRMDTLRRARVSSLIEGQEEHPDDSAVLDAWARGEIDDAEVLFPYRCVGGGDAHDAWFRAKVQEALADASPTIPYAQVMDEMQALIDHKRDGSA